MNDYIEAFFTKVKSLLRMNKPFGGDVDDRIINIDRLEIQTSLSGSMGHEFRNVLSVIIGYSEVLLMKDRNKDSTELQVILDMSQKGLNLINQLKGPVGDVTGERPSITKVLNANVDIFKMLKKNIKIDCWFNSYSNSSLKQINIQYIEQIILNLLINASHAVTANKGRIFVEYLELKKIHEIHVHDTGIGIDDKDLSKIFDLFYSTKGEHGTGIGLAVTLNLVKQLKGTINVENKDWTTFTIRIPK